MWKYGYHFTKNYLITSECLANENESKQSYACMIRKIYTSQSKFPPLFYYHRSTIHVFVDRLYCCKWLGWSNYLSLTSYYCD